MKMGFLSAPVKARRSGARRAYAHLLLSDVLLPGKRESSS